MIEYVNGRLAELTPTTAVVELQSGIAFSLCITLQSYTALEGRDSARLYVHESIREDAWTLYGFVTACERDMFRLLIGVSGVGAQSARMILSSLPAEELPGVIATENVGRLKGVKGIGAKTAQRIIVDLRDKINATEYTLIGGAKPTAPANEAYEEALIALVTLGFNRQASAKALEKVFASSPDAKVEQAIKLALSML